MKLTRGKLRQLIIEAISLDDPQADQIADLLTQNNPETLKQAFEMAIGLGFVKQGTLSIMDIGRVDSFIVGFTASAKLFKSLSGKTRFMRSEFDPYTAMYKVGYVV